MKNLTLCIMLLLLAGCETLALAPGKITNTTLEQIGKPITTLVDDWCGLKKYRQEGLSVLVNGRLAESGYKMTINCGR